MGCAAQAGESLRQRIDDPFTTDADLAASRAAPAISDSQPDSFANLVGTVVGARPDFYPAGGSGSSSSSVPARPFHPTIAELQHIADVLEADVATAPGPDLESQKPLNRAQRRRLARENARREKGKGKGRAT